jgi:hypothetical protein
MGGAEGGDLAYPSRKNKISVVFFRVWRSVYVPMSPFNRSFNQNIFMSLPWVHIQSKNTLSAEI